MKKGNQTTRCGLIFLIMAALLFSAGPGAAVLDNFKNDFDTSGHDNDKTDKDQKPAKPGKSTPATTSTSDTTAPAQPENGTLQNFYNDFNPPTAGNSPNTTQPPQQYYYRYYDYPPDYYRYTYPYYYPYNDYYPPSTMNLPGQQNTATSQIVEEERHSWFNASLESQYVSDTLSAVGMQFSFISAGKIDELSYGFKYEYSLYTEKTGLTHTSLPLSYLGLILGKHVGRGVLEAFIASASLNSLNGLALKLSTDQFIDKYVFLRGGISVSVINSSPLTGMYLGAGFGTPSVQGILGYKVQNSVNTGLNGPEIAIGMIF